MLNAGFVSNVTKNDESKPQPKSLGDMYLTRRCPKAER